ncbi:MAG: hypothetical protein GY818_23015, partial [Planctomycetaceae bacterium]|nr:hypothetical protein [Planctomycetaceae bacterium]
MLPKLIMSGSGTSSLRNSASKVPHGNESSPSTNSSSPHEEVTLRGEAPEHQAFTLQTINEAPGTPGEGCGEVPIDAILQQTSDLRGGSLGELSDQPLDSIQKSDDGFEDDESIQPAPGFRRKKPKKGRLSRRTEHQDSIQKGVSQMSSATPTLAGGTKARTTLFRYPGSTRASNTTLVTSTDTVPTATCARGPSTPAPVSAADGRTSPCSPTVATLAATTTAPGPSPPTSW